jgi:NDP-sugar pyrophosphorylase family protein
VAINLHHLGGAIRERLGTSFRDMPLVYSEEAEVLGTLGALAPLRDFFTGCEAALLINGDSLCRWPLPRLLRRHRRRGAAATLLFATAAEPALYGGGVAIDRKGRVVSFAPGDPAAEAAEKVRRRVFAGAHVLDPRLLARAPRRFSHIVHDLYEPLLAEGERLEAVATGRPWYDLGTPRRFRDAATEGGVTPRWRRGPRRTWTAAGARVDPSAHLGRTVVEAGAAVAARARLRRTVLLPGARVGEGAILDGCVVGFGAEVPAGARVRRRLIARRSAGGTVPAGSSVVADLVYVPLDPQEAPEARAATG